MQTRFKNAKRGIVALATLGLISSGLIMSPAAQAVTPGDRSDKIAVVLNGRYLALVKANGSGTPEIVHDCGNATLSNPSWSPDDTRLVFQCQGDVYVATVGEEDGAALLDQGLSNATPDPAWSPDGMWIAVEATDGNIWLLPAPALGNGENNNPGSPRQVTFDGAVDADPTFSPDGMWIAFTRPANGGRQIHKIKSPAFGGLNNPSTAVSKQTDTPGVTYRDPSWAFGSGAESRILFSNVGNGELGWIEVDDFGNEQDFDLSTDDGHGEYSPDSQKLLRTVGPDCVQSDDDGGNKKTLADGGMTCSHPTWGSTPVMPNPPIVASPSSLQFSAAVAGQTDIKTVTITNVAGVPKILGANGPAATISSPLVISTPTFQFVQPGTDCGDVVAPFNLDLDGGKILPPGGSCDITVLFTAPLSTGTFLGQIAVDDPLPIKLTATVGQGGGGGGGGGEGDLEANKSLMNFGGVKKGKSATIKVKITNTGDAPTGTNPIKVSGKYFSLKKEDCPSSLKAGKSCTVVVKFNPKAKGSFTGELTVDGVSVDLKGKGK